MASLLVSPNCSVLDHFNCSLATVKKRLKGHKAGIGKWNLTIQEKLEKNFRTLLLSLPLNRTLSPKKMIPSSSLVTLTIFAKLFSPESFIPRSLRVFRVTVKRSPLNKPCATLGRELIRVNITVETDEDDLIGGFRLVNGETVWHNAQSLKHCSEVPCCYLTKSISPQTKSSAFNLSLKVREFFSRRLESSLPQQKDSKFLQPQILRVKDPRTGDLLELTCLTRRS